MAITLQPPPVKDKADSVAWKDWYHKFAEKFRTRPHNTLEAFDGGAAGEYYHLTTLQWEQSRSWRSVTATATPVAIDPDTTGPWLSVSADGLTVTDAALGNTFDDTSALANTPISSGKLYWEVFFTTVNFYNDVIGLADSGLDFDTKAISYDTTSGVENWGRRIEDPGGGSDKLYYRNSLELSYSGVADNIGSNSTCMLAVDMDAGNIWTGVNGVWSNSGDPATGANPNNTTPVTGTLFPGMANFRQEVTNSRSYVFRFTAASLVYAIPSGFAVIPPLPGVEDDSFLIPLSGGDSVVLPGGTDWSGRIICIKKTDATLSNCTILLGVGDTFEDGSTKLVLDSPYQSIILQKSTNTWLSISQYTGNLGILNLSKRYSLLVS